MNIAKYERSIPYVDVLISTEKYHEILHKTVQEYKNEYNL